jgi:asparagine synthase (glutamine-hydrolysing)
MFRYFAVAWDPSNPEQAGLEQLVSQRFRRNVIESNFEFGWRCVHVSAGLRVFCCASDSVSEKCQVLAEDSGVVVGTVFEKFPLGKELDDSYVPRAAQLAPHSSKILSTEGIWLVNECWGEYVAFINGRVAGKTWVIRAPCSALPCLRTSFRGVELFYSRFPDIAALGLIGFTINWEHVRSSLLSIGATAMTGLREVTTILSGEGLEIGRSSTRARLYWDARDFASEVSEESVDSAATTLRRTVRASVGAWASRFDSVLVRLSGGLDSAIVLGCLAGSRSSPRIACVNYFYPDAEGDERLYAQAAAQKAGCPLVEKMWNSECDLGNLFDLPPIHLPWSRLNVCEMRADEISLGTEYGAAALFNGDDGDSLFYRSDLYLCAADYAYRHGIRSQLFKICYHAARHEQNSVWNVLWGAMRFGLLDRWDISQKLSEPKSLSTIKALDAARSTDSYERWQQSSGMANARHRIPPGKRWQALKLSGSLDSTTLVDTRNSPDPVSPLHAQPVIETALRIPTYILANGRGDLSDRALARQAFASDLPVEILQRRSKGLPTGSMMPVIRRNRGLLRETLLDGQLVADGLLDRAKVEDALCDMPSSGQEGIVPLVQSFLLEVWLSSWRRYSQQALNSAEPALVI